MRLSFGFAVVITTISVVLSWLIVPDFHLSLHVVYGVIGIITLITFIMEIGKGPGEAETYDTTGISCSDGERTSARDPNFYTGTFCITCASHRPVEEFVWESTDEKVGS